MKMVKDQSRYYPVSLLCELFGIAQSSYYRWTNKKQPLVDLKRLQLGAAVLESHRQSRCIYGRPRIKEDLRKRGICIGNTRLSRLMKEQYIEGRYNKPSKAKTTDSKHNRRISPNLLKTSKPYAARQVVVSDTTYIWSDKGWCYLAAVMDLFTREILGWSFSKNNDTKLISQALWNASKELKGYENILHHSDRGSTYCSHQYLTLLKELKFTSSMSAR